MRLQSNPQTLYNKVWSLLSYGLCIDCLKAYDIWTFEAPEEEEVPDLEAGFGLGHDIGIPPHFHRRRTQVANKKEEKTQTESSSSGVPVSIHEEIVMSDPGPMDIVLFEAIPDPVRNRSESVESQSLSDIASEQDDTYVVL